MEIYCENLLWKPNVCPKQELPLMQCCFCVVQIENLYIFSSIQ